eukprot:3108106-Amphidinium_carterae.2
MIHLVIRLGAKVLEHTLSHTHLTIGFLSSRFVPIVYTPVSYDKPITSDEHENNHGPRGSLDCAMPSKT